MYICYDTAVQKRIFISVFTGNSYRAESIFIVLPLVSSKSFKGRVREKWGKEIRADVLILRNYDHNYPRNKYTFFLKYKRERLTL